MTDVKVYQGHQIGGCVTVITSEYKGEKHRIMIDYGESLPGSDNRTRFEYPWDEEPVDAVFFTHYHGDHSGRIAEIPKNVHLYMGETARQVMENIHDAMRHVKSENRELHEKMYRILTDRTRVHTFECEAEKEHYLTVTDIPNFSIEPYSVDHSAYDAYMFCIEAMDETKPSGRKVIVHTGDFRGHGRRSKAIPGIIDHYIHRTVNGQRRREVDTLVIEGTMMSRPDEEVLTESQMQHKARELFRQNRHVFLICSSTNLDSLAGFNQAWQDVNKPYGGYLYTYSGYLSRQLATFSESAGKKSPVYRFRNVYELNLEDDLKSKYWNEPRKQKELMKQYGFLAVIKAEDFCEKYIDEFLDCEDKPIIIYSMWEGYLDSGEDAYVKKWDEFLRRQEAKGIHVEHLHTSGHATVGTITKVINMMDPQEEIIPMHTEYPEKFKALEINEELKNRIREEI